ncbi:MAG: hypothetical protein FJW68_03820 [Actinobacteria bacterium]|nr:hypothetical protein [Actinomycetota bacterium]
MAEKNPQNSPADNFAEMMKDFGGAIAEIFNDPGLKERAKEFGQSAADSAKTFASRFKDEDVKKKFKDLGITAKKFGDSVASYFKDDANKTESESTGQDPESAGQSGDSPDGGEDDGQEEPETPGQSGKDEAVIYSVEEKQEGGAKSCGLAKAPVISSSERDRNARITGYCFAIAWSIIFIVFFNFFNKYIAFYIFDSQSDTWIIIPFITSAFSAWLPFVNASLLVSIIGNVVLIINDSYYFNNITNIIMHFFSILAAAALLIIFPFDFTVLPATSVLSAILFPLIWIALIVVIVGLSVGLIVRFIKIIVKAVKA